MSADGQYIAIVTNKWTYPSNPTYISVSNNYGSSFSNITTFGFNNINGDIGMSKDGQYILLGFDSDYPQISSDYGITFSPITSIGTPNWRSAAVSTDGKYMLLTEYPGGQWLSSDYGINWVNTTGISSSTLTVNTAIN